MAKVRTFIDSGILIAAARGGGQLSEAALAVLDDPARTFVSSDFVRLEVLSKAKFHKRRDEAALYQTFFDSLGRSCLVAASKGLMAAALEEAVRVGLSAVDALHVAAAKRARCHELYTAEGADKPLFRVQGLAVRTIR